VTLPDSTLPESDLHAYVDGRLAEDRRREVDQFLATHPEDMERARVYQEQNQALHALFDGVLSEPLPTQWQNPRRGWKSLVKPVAAAALWIVIGGWLGWSLRGTYNGRSAATIPFARQAATAHAVYTPEVRHPVEVTAAEEEHLVNWLSKRLGNRLQVPHLSSLGYELVGGRLLPGEQGPVAQFMYQEKNGQRLTLYVKTDVKAQRETAFRFAQEGNVSVFYWIDHRLSYALSGELRKDDLLRIANVVYEKLNP
jgi:anti-sigma factor RsiW